MALINTPAPSANIVDDASICRRWRCQTAFPEYLVLLRHTSLYTIVGLPYTLLCFVSSQIYVCACVCVCVCVCISTVTVSVVFVCMDMVQMYNPYLFPLLVHGWPMRFQKWPIEINVNGQKKTQIQCVCVYPGFKLDKCPGSISKALYFWFRHSSFISLWYMVTCACPKCTNSFVGLLLVLEGLVLVVELLVVVVVLVVVLQYYSEGFNIQNQIKEKVEVKQWISCTDLHLLSNHTTTTSTSVFQINRDFQLLQSSLFTNATRQIN